jgi:antitoxin PrlF
MTTSVLSSKGQIVIPKEVREKLGLDAGDRVQFVEDPNGGYKIVPATGDVRELRGMVAKPKAPVSVEQMNAAIARRAVRNLGGKR